MFSWLSRFLALVAFLGGFCASAAAQDNLLGLPAPRDAKRPGAVVLHGGGRVTDDVFERFVELAGGKAARIVLVPCAGYRHSAYDSDEQFLEAMQTRFSAWVALQSRGRVRSFSFLYTDDPADADDPEFVKPLETATGVWFSGGTQERLNYRFVGSFPEQTRFQAALRRVVERGGVVGGTSAGMAALPEIMIIRQAREYDSAPVTAAPAHGLGLLTRAIVDQHFDGRGGRLERFTGLLRDSARLDELAGRRGVGTHMVGLAVEERTALVAQADRLEVVGSGNAHVFVKSSAGRTVTWHLLEPGDSVQLRRAADNVANAPGVRHEELVLSK